MRYLGGFLCVCALGVVPLVGCGGTSGDGGSGGSAGGAGAGGTGGGMGDAFPCTEQGIRDAIAAGGGPHFFACDGTTPVVTQAEIAIDNDVILDGEGNLTVNGNDQHRVFSVPKGVNAKLHRLTATHGFARSGGGVANEGTLTIRGCIISDNRAEADYDAGGGGIQNAGQMTIIDTTLAENHVTHGYGGGISNWHSATLTLVNSTVSHNSAGIDGGGNVGGGISNGGELTIANSTVSENSAYGLDSVSGGGIGSSGQVSLINSTVSGNLADSAGAIVASDATIANTLIDGDCEIDSTVSHGHNLESPGNTCGLMGSGDLVGVSEHQLNLGPLQDNGGPTETHEPGGGAFGDDSFAIDKIPESACLDADGEPLTEDQRGEARPAGAESKCDVGAFEVQP